MNSLHVISFIYAITNPEAREITVLLNFLEKGNCLAEVYNDANDVNVNPNHLVKETKELTNKDKIELKIVSGGGNVI